jgi:putative heme utilization carrier protein HutX
MSIEPGLVDLRTELAEKPGAVLEEVATRYGVSTRDVLEALPKDCSFVVGGNHFPAVMSDVTDWGDLVFLVHTKDIIAEFKGPVPPGRFSAGYYNLIGSPLGGHIKAENCTAIYFVSRPFMKLESCSIWFMNQSGEAMFKIFVGRNPDRSLKEDQVRRFHALAAGLS